MPLGHGRIRKGLIDIITHPQTFDTGPAALLDVATKLTGTAVATWRPTVGEHSIVRPYVARERLEPEEPIPDPVRSRREAQKRATKMVRRWCVHARLDRLVTLTIAEETDLEDRERVRRLVARFFSLLRGRYSGLHYVYVLELHPGGHGYHVHAAVNQWLDPVHVRACWTHGFIDVRRIKTKVRGSLRDQSRLAGRYISKYATKSEDEGRLAGRHRYERSQGEAIPEIRMEADSWQAVEAWLRSKLRSVVVWSWSSVDQGEDWHGPPTLVLWE